MTLHQESEVILGFFLKLMESWSAPRALECVLDLCINIYSSKRHLFCQHSLVKLPGKTLNSSVVVLGMMPNSCGTSDVFAGGVVGLDPHSYINISLKLTYEHVKNTQKNRPTPTVLFFYKYITVWHHLENDIENVAAICAAANLIFLFGHGLAV